MRVKHFDTNNFACCLDLPDCVATGDTALVGEAIARKLTQCLNQMGESGEEMALP